MAVTLAFLSNEIPVMENGMPCCCECFADGQLDCLIYAGALGDLHGSAS